MGLGPDVWGPYGWKFIHFVALGYPKNPTEEDKLNYKTFFMLIPSILPCSICSAHFADNLLKYPITDDILTDRIKLFNWSVDMHNEVNIINEKKRIDYDTALKLIVNNFKESHIETHTETPNKVLIENKILKQVKKNNNNSDFIKYIGLFIILVFIILYLYFIKKNKTI